MPGAVSAEDRRQKPARLSVASRMTAPGTIPKQNARRAIRPVDEAGQGIGTDDQHPIVESGLHELRADGERVDESRACGANIEGAGVAPELRLDKTGLRDEELIGRTGGDDDQIDVVWRSDRLCRAPAAPAITERKWCCLWGRRSGVL